MGEAIKVQDAGHRERQALLALWKKTFDNKLDRHSTPFWAWLERVEWNPDGDYFVLPDGQHKTVLECIQLQEEPHG